MASLGSTSNGRIIEARSLFPLVATRARCSPRESSSFHESDRPNLRRSQNRPRRPHGEVNRWKSEAQFRPLGATCPSSKNAIRAAKAHWRVSDHHPCVAAFNLPPTFGAFLAGLGGYLNRQLQA